MDLAAARRRAAATHRCPLHRRYRQDVPHQRTGKHSVALGSLFRAGLDFTSPGARFPNP